MTLSIFSFSMCWQVMEYVGEIIWKIATKSTRWKFYYVKVIGEFSPMVYTMKGSLCKGHGWTFTHDIQEESIRVWFHTWGANTEWSWCKNGTAATKEKVKHVEMWMLLAALLQDFLPLHEKVLQRCHVPLPHHKKGIRPSYFLCSRFLPSPPLLLHHCCATTMDW